MLVLAGLAAYRADQLRAALDYWKQALDIAPDERLAAVYERVKREADSDHSGDKLFGVHVALRYEGEALPADTARAILATLDDDYSTIAAQLGCTSEERIVAIVQSREAYLRTHRRRGVERRPIRRAHSYRLDGRIAGWAANAARAGARTGACLPDQHSVGLPRLGRPGCRRGWRKSSRATRCPPRSREQLRQLAETHAIPKLENLRQNWSRMSTQNARRRL